MLVLIELAFAGHIGVPELAGAALGASYANVVGFSILGGLLFAMDTLVSQAYGANEKSRIGVALQQSIVVVVILSILLSPLWFVRRIYNYY